MKEINFCIVWGFRKVRVDRKKVVIVRQWQFWYRAPVECYQWRQASSGCSPINIAAAAATLMRHYGPRLDYRCHGNATMLDWVEQIRWQRLSLSGLLICVTSLWLMVPLEDLQLGNFLGHKSWSHKDSIKDDNCRSHMILSYRRKDHVFMLFAHTRSQSWYKVFTLPVSFVKACVWIVLSVIRMIRNHVKSLFYSPCICSPFCRNDNMTWLLCKFRLYWHHCVGCRSKWSLLEVLCS